MIYYGFVKQTSLSVQVWPTNGEEHVHVKPVCVIEQTPLLAHGFGLQT